MVDNMYKCNRQIHVQIDVIVDQHFAIVFGTYKCTGAYRDTCKCTGAYRDF